MYLNITYHSELTFQKETPRKLLLRPFYIHLPHVPDYSFQAASIYTHFTGYWIFIGVIRVVVSMSKNPKVT